MNLLHHAALVLRIYAYANTLDRTPEITTQVTLGIEHFAQGHTGETNRHLRVTDNFLVTLATSNSHRAEGRADTVENVFYCPKPLKQINKQSERKVKIARCHVVTRFTCGV